MTPTLRCCWLTAALLSTASLTACSQPGPPPRIVTQIEREVVQHPEALLSCEAEPPLPPAPRTVQSALDWVAGIQAALADCRAALACIRARQAGEGCLK